MIRHFLLLLGWLALLAGGVAQAKSGADPIDQRAAELLRVLQQQAQPAPLFALSFTAQIPPEQISTIARQLREQNGQALAVEQINARSPVAGTIDYAYQKAIVRMTMELEAKTPHRIIGLLVASVAPRDDNASKLAQDIASLPGQAGLLVTPLDGRPPLLNVKPDSPYAIGSVFKLWLLAESARQVKSGQRNWTDVIPLGPPSLPSGITQAWPRRTPMTLQSLNTLAISISDNTAADTLLFTLGRANVNAMVARAGQARPARTWPVLSTVENFALKMDSNLNLRSMWMRADPEGRQALLDRYATSLNLASIDRRQLAGAPRFIDQIEWFASPADMARTLNWLHQNGDAETLDILTVNSGIPKENAARFRYLGYKGGSETGVVATAFLIQSRKGDWFTVTGAWNNAATAVDDARFLALMNRAIALIPDD